jgi:hypothetical protein
VTMDGKRREQDIGELESRAEANWIAERLGGSGQWIDSPTVDAVLRLHREYLGLPPPDAILVEAEEGDAPASPSYAWLDGGRLDGDRLDGDRLDGDPDRMADEVGDDGRGRPDDHLPGAGEEQAPTREQAHAGADGEQRADR